MEVSRRLLSLVLYVTSIAWSRNSKWQIISWHCKTTRIKEIPGSLGFGFLTTMKAPGWHMAPPAIEKQLSYSLRL
jgi:hypothetical protein